MVQAVLYGVILGRRLMSIIYDLIEKPSVIIIQREVYPRWIPLIGRKLLGRLLQQSEMIWDFDDDIFQGEISACETTMLQKYSTIIVVTSDYLKSLLSVKSQKKAVMLPTTDRIIRLKELGKLRKKREKSFTKEFRIVWVGTAVNLGNIDLVIRYIEKAGEEIYKKYHKQLIFTVVCNQPYSYTSQYFKIRNIKWSREAAQKEIKYAHLGIMPLVDKKYSLGKGGFKLVQYLSAALPVIASDVGFNKKIVDDGINGFLVKNSKRSVWTVHIMKLAESYKEWEWYANNAMEKYQKEFLMEVNLLKWKTMLVDVQVLDEDL